MPEIYVRLSYRDYKAFEDAVKAFKETTHTTVTGFYHKSLRLPLGDGLELEVHGPTVKAFDGEPPKEV